MDALGPDLGVEVLTTEPTLKLPDLTGLGMVFGNVRHGDWGVIDLGGGLSPGSVDATASQEGFTLLSPIYLDSDNVAPAQVDSYFFFVDAGEFMVAAPDEK